MLFCDSLLSILVRMEGWILIFQSCYYIVSLSPISVLILLYGSSLQTSYLVFSLSLRRLFLVLYLHFTYLFHDYSVLPCVFFPADCYYVGWALGNGLTGSPCYGIGQRTPYMLGPGFLLNIYFLLLSAYCYEITLYWVNRG